MNKPICPNCNKDCEPSEEASINPCGFIMHRPHLKFVEGDNIPIKWNGDAIPDVDWEEILDDTLNSDHWEDMGR